MRESEMRHWALRLHALSASDREWILSKVDEPECGELRMLLEELSSLGLQVDSSVLQGIAPQSSSEFKKEELRSPIPLNLASPEMILHLLDGEPSVVKRIVVGAMPRLRVASSEEYGSNGPRDTTFGDEVYPVVTDRVRFALLNAVAQRINGQPNGEIVALPEMASANTASGQNIFRRTVEKFGRLGSWKR